MGLSLSALILFSGCPGKVQEPVSSPSPSPVVSSVSEPAVSPSPVISSGSEQADPDDSPSSVTEDAQILAKKGQMEKAEDLIRGEIRKNPKNPEFYATLSMLFIQAGKNNSALDICNEGLKALPDNLKLLEEKSAVLMLMEKWGESAKLNRRILELFHSDPAASPDMASLARESIGKAYASGRDQAATKAAFDFAIGDLEKSLSKKPKDELLLREKAFLLMNAKKYDEAVAVLRTVDEVEKENLFISLDIGKCYLFAGKYPLAEKEFEYTISKNPENFRSFRNYGWYWMERGKIEKGEAAANLFAKSAEQYEKALALASLPIDTSFLQFKAAEADFNKWKASGKESDKKSASDAFKNYYKLAPDWTDTDIAEPFMKELGEEKPR